MRRRRSTSTGPFLMNLLVAHYFNSDCHSGEHYVSLIKLHFIWEFIIHSLIGFVLFCVAPGFLNG